MNNDPLLFPFLKNNPNADTTLAELKSTLLNTTIQSVGRHGKYFWLRLSLDDDNKDTKTGVLLMHFGMTGMIKIRNVRSHLVFMENGGDKKILKQMEEKPKVVSTGTESKYFGQKLKKESESPDSGSSLADRKDDAIMKDENMKQEDDQGKEEEELWPPRFVKFEMVLEKGDERFDLVFVDPRRLGRVRYLSGPYVQLDNDLLRQEPLSALGPDYSKPLEPPSLEFSFGDPDPDHHGRPRLTIDEFSKLILAKKKVIKSLLLDQEHFSGVGNWVGDEILYHARIHPNEVLGNKLPKETENDTVHPIIVKLYNSIIYVCEYSVKVEGDVTKFPSNWLMLYRWGKRRKNSAKPKTDEGNEVEFVTVGGRTSCFVPKLQKLINKNAVSDEDAKAETGPRKKRKI